LSPPVAAPQLGTPQPVQKALLLLAVPHLAQKAVGLVFVVGAALKAYTGTAEGKTPSRILLFLFSYSSALMPPIDFWSSSSRRSSLSPQLGTPQPVQKALLLAAVPQLTQKAAGSVVGAASKAYTGTAEG